MAKQDYLTEKGQSEMTWQGEGAARLGLSGQVHEDHFARLCSGRDPFTDKKLTPRDNGANRRVYYQFGPMFEHYITRCLDCSGIDFLDETTLKALLIGTGQCVDFSIVEDNCNILIDSKAVETPPWGRVCRGIIRHAAVFVLDRVERFADEPVGIGSVRSGGSVA